MIHPPLKAKAEALDTLARENRSRYDFDNIVVEWLLARGYAEKIEGETEEDFGLLITDKGRTRLTGEKALG